MEEKERKELKDIEAMKRHLGLPGVIRLENEDGSVDEVEMNPLPMEYLPEFLYVTSRFMKLNPDQLKEGMDDEAFLKLFEPEVIRTLNKCILASLKSRYPEADEDMLKRFISANFIPCFNTFLEINTPRNIGTERVDSRLKKRLELIRKAKKK